MYVTVIGIGCHFCNAPQRPAIVVCIVLLLLLILVVLGWPNSKGNPPTHTHIHSAHTHTHTHTHTYTHATHTHTQVVVIELNDPDQGPITFSVPLNSSLRFSPLYDPTNNIKDAKKGFKFDTIGDILAAKTMPRVVRATKAFNGSSGDNSVAENELLAIKNTKSKLTGEISVQI